MDRLTIRLECIKAAALAFSSNVQYRNRDEHVIAAARNFEQYVVGPEPAPVEVPNHPEVAVVYDKIGNPVLSSDPFPVDLTGYTLSFTGEAQHVHLPRQHRDRKPPWCDHCGLTAHLLVPKVNPFDRNKEDQ